MIGGEEAKKMVTSLTNRYAGPRDCLTSLSRGIFERLKYEVVSWRRMVGGSGVACYRVVDMAR